MTICGRTTAIPMHKRAEVLVTLDAPLPTPQSPTPAFFKAMSGVPAYLHRLFCHSLADRRCVSHSLILHRV